MSVLNNGIRSWWLEKPLSHNMPTDVVFEEYKPTIHNGSDREWIRVISLDDLHSKININITRFVEVCDLLRDKNEELESLYLKLSLQKEMIENLRKSNEFYVDKINWEQPIIRGYLALRAEKILDSDCSKTEDSIFTGGKLARSCQEIDQELQKKLEEVK